ncbi:hypothetical protein LCL95_07335 [Bacillus timonensis]|nr:hypothetical protein [Bacillus timonensis]
MGKLKYYMLSVASVGQIIGIIFLFINLKIALVFYLTYIFAIGLLGYLLLRERLNEKKEDEENDYRDY